MIAWCKSLLRTFWSNLGGRRSRATGNEIDPELCEIFFAELGEVTQALRTACTRWRANPADHDAVKHLRRGFHTIKGSAPLIGATALGDFCAQLERLIDRLIEKPVKTTPETIATVEQAVALLPALGEAARNARPPPAQVRAIGERVRRFLV